MTLSSAPYVLVFAGCVLVASCASDPPSLDPWRGLYSVESSSCSLIAPGTPLRLHEAEPGRLAIQTFMGPDIWAPIDAVTLEVDGTGGLTGSAASALCPPQCASCTAREIRYEHDDVEMTSSAAIRIELARASEEPTETTCNEERAWALAASAVACTVEATYTAPDAR